MLNVACVCVGTAYSTEYVEILYSMVRRNLAGGVRGRFTVFTDNPSAFKSMAGIQTKEVSPDLKGWWAKLYLFSKDAFPKGERVLYFDLDTVITGSLDEIADYKGKFAMLHDAYRNFGFQSAVMAWEAGTLTEIWDRWNADNRPTPKGGDQAIIEKYMIHHPTLEPVWWQDLYPDLFRSYKLQCYDGVPKGCSVVYFHGFPRPHQCIGWVKDVWKISDENLFFAMNVKEQNVRANIRHALTKPQWIKMRDGLQTPAIIVGGGPSLAKDIWRIRGYQLSGGVVFATNNTYKFLKEHGVTPDAHVMHDARLQNLEFVPSEHTLKYYASQCHPEVLDSAGDDLICWHPHSETAISEIGDDRKGSTMVSGGSTIGLNAISLAYILGHRSFMLFGFDSCYEDGTHHAYEQKLNDGELILEAQAHGYTFNCAPWMIQQAEQFVTLARTLIALGCEISVFGYGLIPTIAHLAEPEVTAADLRAAVLLEWLKPYENPVGAEIGVFAGELSRKLLVRKDLTLYLVDSWTAQHKAAYKESGDYHARLTQDKQERFYDITRHMVRFAGDRAKIIRDDSQRAATGIADGSLDFVFIDADHSYEGCKGDIEAWLPKIRKGGFISGHDYENPDFPAWGVKKAVEEKFGTPEKGENFTWRIQL